MSRVGLGDCGEVFTCYVTRFDDVPFVYRGRTRSRLTGVRIARAELSFAPDP